MNKDLIIYEIFPDCISLKEKGKLQDIIHKLPYLSELGINTLWITPIFKSPQKDSGYDVSNYYEIDPIHGSKELFKKLIQEAHSLNVKIILDFVPNHTSNLHDWFIKSENNDPFYKEFYIWRNPRDGREPNNWISKKNNGSVWEYSEKRNQYYLHLYAAEQPDLNWEEEVVRNEIYKAMEYWLDLGVDGFRLDVINKISKTNLERDTEDPTIYYQNMPKVFEYIEEMKNRFKKKYSKDIILIGQAEGIDYEMGKKYQEHLDLILEFSTNHIGRGREFRSLDFKFEDVLINYFKLQKQDRYWPTFFWGSHDLPRVASRYNFNSDHLNTAKIIGIFTLLSKGTPIIYNGDEVGTENCNFSSIERYTDVRSQSNYRLRVEDKNEDKDLVFRDIKKWARDNARQAVNFEDNPDIYEFYKKTIAIRKKYKEIIKNGIFSYEITDNITNYKIKDNNRYLKVIFNNSNKVINRKLENIIIRTQEKEKIEDTIAPYEVVVEGII